MCGSTSSSPSTTRIFFRKRKAATQDIEDILVDADAEENKQNEENSFQDLSQHSSQELSQEQNPDDEDANDDDAVNQRVLLLFFQVPQAPFMFFKLRNDNTLHLHF